MWRAAVFTYNIGTVTSHQWWICHIFGCDLSPPVPVIFSSLRFMQYVGIVMETSVNVSLVWLGLCNSLMCQVVGIDGQGICNIVLSGFRMVWKKWCG